MSVYNELKDRGFISNVTDPEIEKYLNENKVTVYCGFDPTAESLHVGNLVPLMGLAHFQRHGHKVLPLIGGATGMIGDPSGKSEERNLQSITQVMHNADSIKGQMEKVLHFKGENSAFMVNNYDWTHGMSIIDWLRDIGKHFTLSYMLAKDSVKSRLASENGISYTEFSYMTLQSYDFLYLFRNFGCTMQFGGNDQWGNITAGIELVRRADAGKVFGMTFPLMTTSTGEKFGKSAGNAVWLDPEKTSPYQYYQYWINTTDEDVEKMMKLFTFIDVSEIEKVCGEHKLQPHLRKAQTLLAEEATKILHGEEGLKSAQAASAALFGGDLKGLSEKELKSIFNDVPSTVVPREEIKNGINIADLLVNTNMQPSKGKARNLIQQGGCYINNEKAEDPEFIVNTSSLMHKSMIIIRCGKKNYHLVNVK
ncbi:MAG TPA: tyrosine--tRNA ligase [bacterium]|nr:tyrosine--tRNA ligase [bacterium]HPG35591.1 tyrosine--tRNA ligase [bacterium]HPM47091.1 tyrosine--tRNA ligase [bacterium]HRQ70709.1 tyrosine--tRNA ligase [bacterium]